MACRRTEQGQTLPLVSLCLVSLMVASALAVDIGSMAVTNRRLQAVADLAALDAARELTGGACNAPVSTAIAAPDQKTQVSNAAVISAGRNSHSLSGNRTVVVEMGTLTRPAADAGVPKFTMLTTCTASDFPNAVRVRVGDRTPFSFASVIGQSGRTATREAFASRGDALNGEGTFSLGSALASVSTDRSALLNPILDEMLCHPGACSFNLDALSYEGLAAGHVTFGALAAQLGFGTTNELFTTNVALDRILSAAAVVADSSSLVKARGVTALGTLSAAVTGSQMIKLGDLVSADLLTGNEAADVGVNLFNLVTGTAAIANGSHLVSIPGLAVNIPGVLSVGVSFSLIEAPVIIGKLPGATRTTKQLALTITPQLNLTAGTLAGLSLTGVTGGLTIVVSGGVATGTLTGVRCGISKGIDVNVKPTAASITTSGNLNVSLTTGGGNSGVLQLLGGLLGSVVAVDLTSSLTVSGAGASTATPVAGYNRSFAYPSEFGPTGVKHVGNTTIGFSNVTYGTTNLVVPVKTTLLGVTSTTNVSTSVNSAAIASLLQPVTSGIDTKVVQPLMESLGLDLGAADIMGNSLSCGIPKLG